jgi:hypothetical protein
LIEPAAERVKGGFIIRFQFRLFILFDRLSKECCESVIPACFWRESSALAHWMPDKSIRA